MKISEIMRKDFVHIEPSEPVSSAAKKMAQSGFSEVPVLQGRKFAGMFMASDLAALLVKKGVFSKPHVADAKSVRNEKVGRHIRSMRTWLGPDADLISAFLLLIHRNVDIIPVLDKEQRVLGVVHAADVRREMARLLSSDGKKLPVRTQESLQEMDVCNGKTPIDQLVHYVQGRGFASASEVAKHCRLTEGEVESYAISLEKNGLLRLEYDIFGRMKLAKPKEEL